MKGNVTSSYLIQIMDRNDFALKLESKGIRHKDKKSTVLFQLFKDDHNI